MSLTLLGLSAVVATVGVDMLLLSTSHKLPQIEEDKARYGPLAQNLTVEQRILHETNLGIVSPNFRTAIAVVLSVSGSLGVGVALFMLLAPP